MDTVVKQGDFYYQVNPWLVIEEGYDPTRNQVSESIFSLANEYMGVRGFIEEGVTAPSLIGSYFNGIYEVGTDSGAPHYKGIVRRTHFMVNAVNWLYTRLTIDGERVDIATSTIKRFRRTLNLKEGHLLRSFILVTPEGKEVELSFHRFLSMTNPHYGYQRITVRPLNGPVRVELITGLDYRILHWGRTNYWNVIEAETNGNVAMALGETLTTHQRVFSAYRLTLSKACEMTAFKEEKRIGHRLQFAVNTDEIVTIDKAITHLVDRESVHPHNRLFLEGVQLFDRQPAFDTALQEQVAYWGTFWDDFDIEIEGDERNQQGIRYCIFQLHQTYHGVNPTNNIGAKGLTGEAYSGHAFWDTETYCLPFFLFTNPEAAKNLLLFRYHTLAQAKQRARALDCDGAWYPIATLNGEEGSTLWQHSNLQMQPSTAVAYGIWHYVKVTGDSEFLYDYGAEMLIEISRMLVSRGQWNATKTKFGYYGVMGPDEFQMMVNHNAYTNYMAKRTLDYTLTVIDELKREDPKQYEALCAKINFQPKEMEQFKICRDAMYIPYDDKRKLFEQHEGFFDLPHIEIQNIPIEEFPLYNHWSYDRIFRNDMIKQPDVLMFLFLYNQSFSPEQKRANFDYYDPRTIHESSLSPSIHSIFAAEFGLMDQAVDYFRFATRMDLDDYNRNTCDGLHMTSIAAAWMNIVYGFGGLRSDGDMLVLNPSIPPMWQRYCFRLTYRGTNMRVNVNQKEVTLNVRGHPITFSIYGKIVQLHDETLVIPIREV